MYNLMMVGRENFWDENRSVEWERGRFLSHTNPTTALELGKLDGHAIDRLLSFRCLFMYEFTYSARDGIGAVHSKARVGDLHGLEVLAEGVRVSYVFDTQIAPIDSQKLSEKWKALGIDVSRNENCRTHWAVKEIDLGAALSAGGLITWQPRATSTSPFSRAASASQVSGDRGVGPKPEPKPTDAPEVVQELREIARTAPQSTGERPKVFVVHGRDDGRKNEVARWLAKVGMNEVVLHEQPNLGRSILTKFRELTRDTRFAVVIATPDDVGGLVGESQSARARQNVVLELGFFIGVLGPERVALLRCDPKLEIPSDYSGILMIDYDARGAWKVELAREFKALGIPFDAGALL